MKERSYILKCENEIQCKQWISSLNDILQAHRCDLFVHGFYVVVVVAVVVIVFFYCCC